MGQAINRTTLEYRKSVNLPDYPVETWIHDPDMSGVSGVEKHYWKIVVDDVLEMNQGEKDIVDADELAKAEKALERGNTTNGPIAFADWISGNNIGQWTLSQKNSNVFIPLQNVMTILSMGGLSLAKSVVENSVSPVGLLTQDLLDDLVAKMDAYL